MAFKDLQGPDTEACVNVADKISKHLHCVSKDGTKSFAKFLAEQGAKKGHPYYEAERARIKGQPKKAPVEREGDRRVESSSSSSSKSRSGGGGGGHGHGSVSDTSDDSGGSESDVNDLDPNVRS